MITDKNAQEFSCYFTLTSIYEDAFKNLTHANDLKVYLQNQMSILLPDTKEKQIVLYEFSPAGLPGYFTILHA